MKNKSTKAIKNNEQDIYDDGASKGTLLPMQKNKKSTVQDPPMKAIVQLAKKLLAIRSNTSAIEGLHEAIGILGEELVDYTIEPYKSNNIPSLLVHNQKPGTKKFKILLNCHLDVVPGNDDQFDPYIEGDKLVGRGAFDMKGAAAVMTHVFKDIAKDLSYPVALLIVTDEETGGYDGMSKHVKNGLHTDFSITGECGSNFNIVYRAKGICRAKLVSHGKRSHSAYPWRGDNAIMKLYEAIGNILAIYPLPKKEAFQTTINVTNISDKTKEVHTITPDYCEAILDVRYTAEDAKDVFKNIKKSLPKGVTFHSIFNEPMVDTDPQNQHVQLLKKTTESFLGKKIKMQSAHATSDLRHLAMIGVPAVEFGPIGGDQHHHHEWVSIASLGDYYQILKNYLLSIK